MTEQRILVINSSHISFKLNLDKLFDKHKNARISLLTLSTKPTEKGTDRFDEIIRLQTDSFNLEKIKETDLLKDNSSQYDCVYILINFQYDWYKYRNIIKIARFITQKDILFFDCKGKIKPLPTKPLWLANLYEKTLLSIFDLWIFFNLLCYLFFKKTLFSFYNEKRPENNHQNKQIAFYHHSLTGGGVQKIFSHLINYFGGSKQKTDWLTNFPYGYYLDEFPERAQLKTLSNRSWMASIYELMKYLTSQQPDVILSTQHIVNLATILAHRMVGSKSRLVIRICNNFEEQFKEYSLCKRIFFPLLIKKLYPKADATIFISKGNYEELKKITGADFSNPQIIYNPVDIDKINALKNEPIEHPWCNSNVPIILGVGRLVKQKDFATLIKALSLIKTKTNARMVLLGRGKLKAELENLIDSLGLRDRVKLLGHVKNPYKYMHSADVFVLSSLWEGLGNVLIESLVVDTPIISTRCPSGPAEILENGKYGALVPPGNPEKMANALLRFFQNNSQSTAVEYQERAKDFEINTVCKIYEDVLLQS